MYSKSFNTEKMNKDKNDKKIIVSNYKNVNKSNEYNILSQIKNKENCKSKLR